MKKMHRISLVTAMSIVLVIIGLFPSGVTFADKAFQTVSASFSSLDPENYPLKDGFVVSTHMNGPINFEKKVFQLHGAKPNTKFSIVREFEGFGLFPSGESFWTDEHGNGHIITSASPTTPNLVQLKNWGIDHLTLTNLLYDGGTPAYRSETYVTYFDWEWTP